MSYKLIDVNDTITLLQKLNEAGAEHQGAIDVLEKQPCIYADAFTELKPDGIYKIVEYSPAKELVESFSKGFREGLHGADAHWRDNYNGTISCSSCHTWFHKDDRYSYMRYCPYCGIKMKEGELEND